MLTADTLRRCASVAGIGANRLHVLLQRVGGTGTVAAGREAVIKEIELKNYVEINSNHLRYYKVNTRT